MKKPIIARETQYTEQKNKRSEAIKAKNKAHEMSKHKTRTVTIERGLWIQVNDFVTPDEIIRQRFIENHTKSQYSQKGGKNVL